MIPFQTYDVVIQNFDCPGIKPGAVLTMKKGPLNGHKFHVSVEVAYGDMETVIAVWDESSENATLIVPETFEVSDPDLGKSFTYQTEEVFLRLCTDGPVEVGVSLGHLVPV